MKKGGDTGNNKNPKRNWSTAGKPKQWAATGTAAAEGKRCASSFQLSDSNAEWTQQSTSSSGSSNLPWLFLIIKKYFFAKWLFFCGKILNLP
jgi:hypothetical protein